jgi:heme exporter protein B
MRIFLALMFQQIRLGWRGGQTVLAIAFLFIAVTLLPFGIGPELRLLKELAPGLVWVVMLLTLMATLDRLFQADLEDGALDQLFLLPLALELVVLAKATGHFVVVVLPLLLAVPLAGILLNIEPVALPSLMAALALGAPSLVLLGAIGAALSVTVRRATMLTGLLVMPLYVPVLIFGIAASTPSAGGDGVVNAAGLGVLALFGLAALLLAPVAIAAALRAGLR